LKETASISPAAGSSLASQPLAKPVTTARGRLRWRYVVAIVSMHLLALLAFWPALFSWSGVIAVAIGKFLFATLGINVCYHRLLAHRSFRCRRGFEHFLALLGVCSLQDTPLKWVAAHRMHHQHSDEQSDPHSPLVSFFWSHMGWLWIENDELTRLENFGPYVKDLRSDRFYVRLERDGFWLAIQLAQWVGYFLVGAAIGWFSSGQLGETLRMGASLLVWGVFVRTVLVWHITWAVNSVTHVWGYRNYATNDASRNNWLVGLLSNGEGWHNNHHAQPRAAAHGHRWWEVDVSFLTLRLLNALGVVWDLVLPKLDGAGANPPANRPRSVGPRP
jgi:stearoyl-CoA desaturase (delta-9 desaturase)